MNIELEQRKKFIKRYLGQKDSLSTQCKEMIQKLNGGKILLYALVDLDESLKFCENWLVITEKKFFLIAERAEDALIQKEFDLSRIAEVREVRSLSCTSLTFIEAHDKLALAKVNFTHRQKIIMGHIKYFCENRENFLEQERLDEENSSQSLLNQEGEQDKADRRYQEAVMKPVLEAQNSVTSENAKTLWRLLSYLLPYKKELIIGCTGAVLTTLVSMIPAYLSGKLVDDVIQPFQDGRMDLNEASSIGWLMVAALGTTYLLREFFIYVRLNKMSILGERVARDLREELYKHLQSLSMDFYSKKQTGSIISRVSSDTDRIWDFVAFGVVETGIAIITLVGLSTVLIALDWQLGIIMALPVPILLYSIYAHGENMKKLFLKAWRKWSNVTAVLSDTIPGMQVVKAFNQEKREEK
ncbi:MAG: ABC transporter transmembrane domain-containing protein, partial [Halobacteriovoraceae bacterium]|nr:ABC transporter transmembrane domain-containing protein [Halobacteriovoraceae bacterium]